MTKVQESFCIHRYLSPSKKSTHSKQWNKTSQSPFPLATRGKCPFSEKKIVAGELQF